MSTDYSYYSEIAKLEFYVLGSKENCVDSAIEVTNKELFKGDIPVSYGCYDPSMGVTAYNLQCPTCLKNKMYCNGHSGSISLAFPVKNPLFRTEIIKWLKIICFKCGRPLIDKEISVSKSKFLNEYVKLAKGIDTCPWEDCGASHPNIVKDKFEQSTFYAEYRNGKAVKREELYNHVISDILNKISNETVLKMHKSLNSHPHNFILDIIRVPPNTIRPDIRLIGGSRSNNNDITALTKKIVEINEVLPIEIPPPNEISKELREMYFNLDLTYYEMVKGGSSTNNQVRLVTNTNKIPNSIANRLPKKTGRIRNNLQGKRTRYMMRSVDVIADNRWLLYRVLNLL